MKIIWTVFFITFAALSSAQAGCYDDTKAWLQPYIGTTQSLQGDAGCENIQLDESMFTLSVGGRWSGYLEPTSQDCSEVQRIDGAVLQIEKSYGDYMDSSRGTNRVTMEKNADGSLKSILVEVRDDSHLGGLFSSFKTRVSCQR